MIFTDLSDTTDALLRDPLNNALHSAVADRMQEECPDPRRALLDLVCKHRTSDGPRLAFATWLEMNGEGARGEFIRIQCELERLLDTTAQAELDTPINDAEGNWRLVDLDGQFEGLRQRERKLWEESIENKTAFRWFEPLANTELYLSAVADPSRVYFQQTDGSNIRCEVRRGFGGHVTCSASSWLANADAICAVQPIEAVTLTSRPVGGDFWQQTNEAILAWLSGRWPGVAFTLPPEVGTPANDYVDLTPYQLTNYLHMPAEMADYASVQEQILQQVAQSLAVPPNILHGPPD